MTTLLVDSLIWVAFSFQNYST